MCSALKQNFIGVQSVQRKIQLKTQIISNLQSIRTPQNVEWERQAPKNQLPIAYNKLSLFIYQTLYYSLHWNFYKLETTFLTSFHQLQHGNYPSRLSILEHIVDFMNNEDHFHLSGCVMLISRANVICWTLTQNSYYIIVPFIVKNWQCSKEFPNIFS